MSTVSVSACGPTAIAKVAWHKLFSCGNSHFWCKILLLICGENLDITSHC